MKNLYFINPIHRLPAPGGRLVRTLAVLRRGLRRKSAYNSSSLEVENKDSQERYGSFVKVTISRNTTSVFNDLFTPLLPFDGVEIYLHGSRADNSYNSFSDFDDLIIIDSEKIREPHYPLEELIRELNRVDMRFCRRDPLQHHGHWIIDKKTLDRYDESYMPLVVLENAFAIKGSQEITYRVDREISQKGLIRNIENTANNILKMYEKFDSGRLNCYGLKKFVGSFALMPAFLFQLKGEKIDKPEAIRRAHEVLSEDAVHCIEWATAMRNSWNIITSSPKFRIFSVWSRLFTNPFLYRRFASRYAPLINVDAKSIDGIEIEKRMVKAFVNESKSFIL